MHSGQTVQLTVETTGTDAVYQWFKDSKHLQLDCSDLYITHENTLTIECATYHHSGEYSCIIKNRISQKTSLDAVIKVGRYFSF